MHISRSPAVLRFLPGAEVTKQTAKKIYAALSVSGFLNALGSNIHLSVWPFYLQRSVVSDALYGSFTTGSSIVGIFARAASSKLGERAVRLPLLLGIAASAIEMLLFGFFPQPAAIALGITLGSVSFALVFMGRTLVVGRSGQTRSLGLVYGLLITLGNLGLIAGTNLGVFAFASLGYTLLFAAGGVVCLAALAIAFVWLPRERGGASQGFSFLGIRGSSPTLRGFYLGTAMDSFAWSIAMPFFAITPARVFPISREELALLQTIVFGISTATNVVLGLISDRISGRKAMMIASELIGLGAWGIFLLAPTVSLLYVSALLMGLVLSTWGPIVQAYVTEATKPEAMQDTVATWTTLNAIARVPGPLIGGLLAELWFPKAPMLVCLPFIAATAVVIQKFVKEPKKL